MIKKISYRELKDIYFITENGILYNDKGKKLKLYLNEKGYYSYHFAVTSGKRKSYEIHRLVAHMFIGPSKGLYVDHIDCNKINNRVSNLEYVTPKENARRAQSNGLYQSCEDRYNSNLSNEDVHEICRMLEKEYTYNDILDKFDNLTRDVLKKIKSGDNYKQITDQYRIPKGVKSKYPEGLKRLVNAYISVGYSNKEIMEVLKLDNTYKAFLKGMKQRYKEGSTTIENVLIFHRSKNK